MLRILSLIVLVSACGGNPKCDKADFDLAGMCVITNGHSPISRDQIAWAVNEVEAGINKRHPGLNLVDLLDEHQVSLSYVDHLSYHDKDKGGITIDPRDGKDVEDIELKWFNAVDEQQYIWGCNVHSAILSHELMHAVATLYMSVSNEDNEAHHVEDLFLPEGCPNRYCTSMEAEIWKDASPECIDYPVKR